MMRLGVATFIAVIYFGVATIVGHYFGRHVVVVEQAHILGSSNTHKGDFILSNDANYYVLKDDRSDTVYYVPHSNVQSIKARSVHSRMLGND
jgi:RNA polymerase-interacting CarD/CdnL/TRCF family regulator